jgi:hypothetical protein
LGYTSNFTAAISRIKVTCDSCEYDFDPRANRVSKGGATIAGSGAGAYYGSQVGIALGPWGAIAGTVPGAVLGAIGGAALDTHLVRCPYCDQVQLV